MQLHLLPRKTFRTFLLLQYQERSFCKAHFHDLNDMRLGLFFSLYLYSFVCYFLFMFFDFLLVGLFACLSVSLLNVFFFFSRINRAEDWGRGRTLWRRSKHGGVLQVLRQGWVSTFLEISISYILYYNILNEKNEALLLILFCNHKHFKLDKMSV